MPWKPGESGNLEGARRQKQWRASLDRAIAQDDGVRLRAAAEKLLDLAASGEQWAALELGNRLDGKAAQSITVEGTLNHRDASKMSDAELAAIATQNAKPDA